MKSHDFYERRQRVDTPRLMLRPMRRDDAQLVVAWRNEPSTAEMFFSEPPTLQEHNQWFDSRREGRVDYMIVRKDEDRPIGVVNYKYIDEGRGRAEAGKLVGDLDSRGQGMAKESFAAWLLFGFGNLGLRRVLVRTRTDNTTNIELNRKLGFEPGDRFRQQGADGEYRTFMTMTLHRHQVHRREYFREIDCQGYFDGQRGTA